MKINIFDIIEFEIDWKAIAAIMIGLVSLALVS